MGNVMTDVDLAARYNSVVAGIAEIEQQAKQGSAQAGVLLPRLAEFMNSRTVPVPPSSESKNNAIGFPPEMTKEDIAGELGPGILLNFLHQWARRGAWEAAEEMACRIGRGIDRDVAKGADQRTAMIAIFSLAQTAASALLAMYPDFQTLLRAHGVPQANHGRLKESRQGREAEAFWDADLGSSVH